jgi:hypothetical protein
MTGPVRASSERYFKDIFLDLTDIGALDVSFGMSTFPCTQI